MPSRHPPHSRLPSPPSLLFFPNHLPSPTSICVPSSRFPYSIPASPSPSARAPLRVLLPPPIHPPSPTTHSSSARPPRVPVSLIARLISPSFDRLDGGPCLSPRDARRSQSAVSASAASLPFHSIPQHNSITSVAPLCLRPHPRFPSQSQSLLVLSR
ncbi:hypothetical protein DFH09DRAFT_1174708 [Mycena vulgaris]|nr:hypothetical protein DFH09DRAFT_1174708 [Mycena vulgaris]